MDMIACTKAHLDSARLGKDHFSRVSPSVFKFLCNEDNKLWNTLLLHSQPNGNNRFNKYEVRFCNYFLSDHAKEDTPSHKEALHQSGFMSTCSKVLSFYKSIFDDNKDVWTTYEEQLKTSCTITVLESYPESENKDYKRVVGAITFWYDENSIVINMMGVCEKYQDLTKDQVGIPSTPYITSNWRGKGLGIILLRTMYLYYNQIHPLSSGDVFLQVWHTNHHSVAFFKRIGFSAVEVNSSDLQNKDYLKVLEQTLHPSLFEKIKGIRKQSGLLDDYNHEQMKFMFGKHPKLDE